MNTTQTAIVTLLSCTLLLVGIAGAIFVSVSVSRTRCSSTLPVSLNANNVASNRGGHAVAGSGLYSAVSVLTSLSGPGAVFMYRRSSADAAPQLVSRIDDPQPDVSEFGSALVFDGSASTLVVGAPLASCAYVYFRSTANASLFVLVEQLKGEFETERFGASLSLLNNSLVVGVPGSSSVDVFERANATALFGARRQRITANDRFGAAVALGSHGRVLLVGAPLNGDGVASLFNRSTVADAFAPARLLNGTGISPGAKYGAAVALNHDATLAAIGAPEHSTIVPGARAGAVALFNLRSSSSSLIIGAEQFAQFGFDVALSTLGTRHCYLAIGSYSSGEVAGDVALVRLDGNSVLSTTMPFSAASNRSQIGRAVAFGQRALLSAADRLNDGSTRIASQVCIAEGA